MRERRARNVVVFGNFRFDFRLVALVALKARAISTNSTNKKEIKNGAVIKLLSSEENASSNMYDT